jgi:amidohydrolase
MAQHIIDRIQAKAEALHPNTIQDRRTLHANPELAFEEHQTAAFVTQRLQDLGIPCQTGVAKTGVVGMIEGKKPGPTIALRADMDALPILEENAVDYASRNAGKMHACGHDAHTASLLNTAAILHELRDEMHGSIKLVFQPSEEKLPGGASVMVQEGVVKGVAAIVGQHVTPTLAEGKIGLRSGMYMASADEIYITIKGKGGHGAQPQSTIDPIAIGCQMITALQQVVSRNADPRTPSVLTFGTFMAKGATNIIPETVYIEGTFRTFDEKWRDAAHKRIAAIAHGIAEGMGAEIDFKLLKGYPVLHNDEQLSAKVRTALEQYMGADNVVDMDLWMASEDFAYYTQAVPGCFYRLGTRNEAKGIIHGLHTPKFDIDERALRTSTGLMAWTAWTLLHGA